MKRWQRRIIAVVLELLLIGAAMVFAYYGFLWAWGRVVEVAFPGS